jgi:muconolactone D-isomerase
MLNCVQMDVCAPHDVDPSHFEQLRAAEKVRAQELQRVGKWPHL